MARKDVNAFIELALSDDKGRLLKQAQVHLDVMQFIADNQFGVIELHRECGKTTNMIGLIGSLIGHNPNIRVKIVCSSDGLAVSRGKAIRELLESKKFHVIFPNIRPGREWSDSKFTVARDTISPEATVECYGVNSHATGGRCDWLFLDDVDDEDVVISEAKRVRNWERVANVWLNLLTPEGRAFAFATPWHEKDVVHKLKAQGWPSLRKPVINMQPVWPERWGEAQLKARKAQIGSMAFARGFELIPINTEAAPIKGPWFRTWQTLPKMTAIGIACDPNNSLNEKADYTAIGVFGVTFDFKVYLLEVLRSHFEFPGLMTAIIRMAEQAEAKYKMTPIIGVEDTAYQRAIPQQLKVETRFPIMGLRADKSKLIRASRLAVHIENGRVWLKAGEGSGGIHSEQVPVYDECVSFPASAHYDCVDMMGYGVELMLKLARKSGAAVG